MKNKFHEAICAEGMIMKLCSVSKTAIGAFTLAFVMVFTSFLPVIAAQQAQIYRDVPPTHFAFDAINWVSDPANGAFMVGDAGNNFQPNRVLNKFEAAQIFAMAAGFRHVSHQLPPAEREVFTRSFDMWRPFLDSLAEQFSRWNRTFDREIAFLLYQGILNVSDVNSFISRTGGQEQISSLTRQEAIVWTVRLMGRQAHAQAMTLPHHTPFRDDSYINPDFRRYLYYAKDAEIIQGANGYINPVHNFTRAETASLFFNVLGNGGEVTIPAPGAANTGVATISGTIASMVADTQINITSGAGTENFRFTPNAVVMVDNVQRTPSFLREGMHVTALINAERNILTLVARTEAEEVAATATTQSVASTALYSDEGFVTAVGQNSITIRTRRVRLSGQIVDEERTFAVASGARITRGGVNAALSGVQEGDIAIFRFRGSTIYELSLLERERTLEGILIERRPAIEPLGNPILVLEENSGVTYELRALPTTTFSRGEAHGLNWSDLRIGDSIVAEVEYDQLVSVQAEGERSIVDGRLTGIGITQTHSQLTLMSDGTSLEFVVMPGIYDVYTLRIGADVRLMLDSREVTDIHLRSIPQVNDSAFIGYIQAINPANNTIIVVAGHGMQTRTFNLGLTGETFISRSGARVGIQDLRVNMNVYVTLTAPGSNVARNITILP